MMTGAVKTVVISCLFLSSVFARPTVDRSRIPHPVLNRTAFEAWKNETGLPGVFGVDMSSGISAGISAAQWECMHTQGNYDFAIIQGWQGGYGLNKVRSESSVRACVFRVNFWDEPDLIERSTCPLLKDIATAVNRAKAAGFAHVDVYAFMCPNCHCTTDSVVELVNYLQR